jgi:signal peptidase II
VSAALVTALLDQASKLWLLHVYDLGSRGRVPVLPFFDLVLVWNKGISYGLLAQDTALGQWALLGFKALAAVFLWAGWRGPKPADGGLPGLIIWRRRGECHRPLRLWGGSGFALLHLHRVIHLQLVRL